MSGSTGECHTAEQLQDFSWGRHSKLRTGAADGPVRHLLKSGMQGPATVFAQPTAGATREQYWDLAGGLLRPCSLFDSWDTALMQRLMEEMVQCRSSQVPILHQAFFTSSPVMVFLLARLTSWGVLMNLFPPGLPPIQNPAQPGQLEAWTGRQVVWATSLLYPGRPRKLLRRLGLCASTSVDFRPALEASMCIARNHHKAAARAAKAQQDDSNSTHSNLGALRDTLPAVYYSDPLFLSPVAELCYSFVSDARRMACDSSSSSSSQAGVPWKQQLGHATAVTADEWSSDEDDGKTSNSHDLSSSGTFAEATIVLRWERLVGRLAACKATQKADLLLCWLQMQLAFTEGCSARRNWLSSKASAAAAATGSSSWRLDNVVGVMYELMSMCEQEQQLGAPSAGKLVAQVVQQVPDSHLLPLVRRMFLRNICLLSGTASNKDFDVLPPPVAAVLAYQYGTVLVEILGTVLACAGALHESYAVELQCLMKVPQVQAQIAAAGAAAGAAGSMLSLHSRDLLDQVLLIVGTAAPWRRADRELPVAALGGVTAPFSPPSAKSSGRRRVAGRRVSGPLSSLPSNIQEEELPMLDSQATGGDKAAGATQSPSIAGREKAAGSKGHKGKRSAAAAAVADGGGGGGGGSDDSDEDMPDAGRTNDTPRTSDMLPTPGVGVTDSVLQTPGGRAGANMRSRASSYIPSAADSDVEGNRKIWGTTFTQSDMQAMIRRFLVTFHAQSGEQQADEPQQADDGMATYVALLRQMISDGHTFLNIDAQHVKASSPRLLTATIECAEDMLLIWDDVINRLAAEQQDLLQDLGIETLDKMQARLFNLDNVRPIRDLDPLDIDCLVSVKGMITRTGNIIPDLRVAVFRCESCAAEAHDLVEKGVIKVPTQCAGCGAKQTMRLIPNRSAFMNRQIVKMQEDPTNIPEGETPRSLLMYAFDTNVDACKPGDRITVTGVFRATRLRLNPRQRASHALFKTYLDVVHVQKEETDKLFRPRGANTTQASPQLLCTDSQAEPTQTQGGPDVMISGNLSRQELAEKEAKFKAMAADPQHYQKLIASVAPRVIDMDNVKRGLLCQLFGGVSKSTAAALGGDSTSSAGSSSKGSIRGDINVLVVGDPSVSKSQLLGFVHHVAPRGIYTSGKGSSAVGLTAYVTRDPETNEMVLESGALVLSDRGICCIDEFDKMSDGARAMLHEVMEQQTVSVAKAGLVSQLNARTSILACANPKGSRYIPDMSLAENINLPPTLLSRFDLVYLVLDQRDNEKDRKLAKHLISLFWRDVPANTMPPYSADELREFIAYARARITPELTPEAEVRLVESYKELRKQSRADHSNRVAATPRQLEAMIRISEALARMHLRHEVTEEDVRSAYRLWHEALSVSSADEEGRLDLSLLTTGASGRQQHFLADELPAFLRNLLTGERSHSRAAPVEQHQ
eukprot:gene2347-2653_t